MQEIEEVKDNFLRSVKGTFTEPVERSLASVNELLATQLDDEQTKIVNILGQTLSRLHKNSQNLVHLSDIKTESFQINIEPFAPILAFEKIIRSFQDAAKEAGIHLLAYIDPNAPKEIYADEQHIIKIMENIIHNAISYTKRGGSVYVDLKTKHISNTKVSLNVSVTDTGIGIEKSKIRDYLHPFSPLNSNNLGVGLSTSYHMLKEMNSQLKIASELNKGSRFSFALEVQSSVETLFTSHPDIKIGVFIDDRSIFAYAKLLYQYIISMGLAVVSIKDLDDPNINQCQGVFLVTDVCDPNRTKKLVSHFPNTSFIPTILAEKSTDLEKLGCVDKLLLLPALPSAINQSLSLIEQRLSKEIRDANDKDHKAMQHIAEQAHKKKIKILVVEDNPINLKLVAVVLSRYDFEVDSAENGQIAVDLCKEKRYDMVLMDIDMPVMDGITAAQTIKSYEQDQGLSLTPIVALTSHDLAGERTEIIASGLDEHMPKPLNIGRLELMLENYIGYKPERSK